MIAESMDNNNSQSFGDLSPSVCLLSATTAISRPLNTGVHLTHLKKQPQTCLLLVVVQWWFVSLLIKLLIGSENCALSLCMYMVSLRKSGHTFYIHTVVS